MRGNTEHFSGDVISKEAGADKLSSPVPNLPKRDALPKRRRSFNIDKAEVVRHVVRNFDQDIKDRIDWSDARIQRYAKLRGWMEPKDYPWPNASNAQLPLMMQNCLRTEDTLHNAVLSQRPVMSANALKQEDKDKGDDIDKLIDYQIFIENKGEERIGDLIQSFVEDGTFVCHIVYVREDMPVTDVKTFPPIPEGMDPQMALLEMIRQSYPDSKATPVGTSPFTWKVEFMDEQGVVQKVDVDFYHDDKRLQMFCKRKLRTFDGPCLLPKQLEDVVVPSRSGNLQPPSPSNPRGAPHVILVDYPTFDEIKRLYKSGYYDLLTEDELKEIEAHHSSKRGMALDPESAKVQKDSLAGHTYGDASSARERFTRYMAYDRWDIDGDGLEEDVIFWVIRESKTLLRARTLTEMNPAIPPRRPFAEARFIPVPEQFYGVGLPELMEHVVDMIKVTFDQMIDAGTLANTPWGLYKAASGVRPEIIRMYAGELYPTANPKEDIFFPQMPNQNQTFGMNTVAMLNQFMDKLTMVGDLQLGRVPQGKASALRTVSGMQTVLQQGDARPERILRRFFRGLAEVWAQVHELNQAFLPPGKQYRVVGVPENGKDAYKRLDNPAKIRGRFQFDFKANILNTNKASEAAMLQSLAGLLINGMTMQMGIMDPERVYMLLSKITKAMGQDPEKLLHEPVPGASGPKITWEEALTSIMNGMFPTGAPMEGPNYQLQQIQAFVASDKLGLIQDEGSLKLLHAYMQSLVHMAQGQAAQMAMVQHAQQFGQQASGGGQGGPQPQPQHPDMGGSQPKLQGSELMDETLPSAGGGASGAQ